MSIACGSDRPPMCSSSRHSSKLAESLPAGSSAGKTRSMPRPSAESGIRLLASIASRARIQFRLPRTVLISPLCAIYRYGWASCQDGNVLVENREWTMASADRYRSSDRSGKKGWTWGGDSIPLYTMVRDDRLAKYMPLCRRARLRRQNAIRSSSIPRCRPVPARKSCARWGCTARAPRPQASGWCGTSRQPRTTRFSASASRAMAALASFRPAVSLSRNTRPAA